MCSEEKDRDVEYVEVDEIEGEEEQDETVSAIEDYLKGITPGMTVHIYREEPSEYRGWLETKTVSDADNPIDLNYLINKWGGHKLRLKFRRPNGRWAKHVDIDLYSYDPLVMGRPLKREFVSPHLYQGETQITKAAPPSPPPDPLAGLTPLLAVLQGMRQGELDLIQKLMPAPQAPQAPQPISQLGEILGLFMQMQSFAAKNNPPPQTFSGESDEAQIMGLVGKAIDAFGASQKGRERVTRLTAGSPQHRPNPGPPPNIRPIKPLEQQLAELPPDEILSTFQKVLSTLPPEKQEIAMDQLLDALEKLGMIDSDDPEEVDDIEDSAAENTGRPT